MAGIEASELTHERPALATTPLVLPNRILMGPGPSSAHPRVLAAAAMPLLGHMHPEVLGVMDEVQTWLRYMFQTSNAMTLAVSGTGHAAMEAAVANVVEPGDIVLVGVNGIWGERMTDLAARYGADVRRIDAAPGTAFTYTNGSWQFSQHQSMVLIGMYALFALDTVCTLGGVPLFVDSQGVDVAYSGSQKCLSAPPGQSPLTLSSRATAKLANRKTKVASYYFDLNLVGEYWGVGGVPRKYHHTGMVSNTFAMREALAMAAEEGIGKLWKRHREMAAKLYAGLEELGLELFVKDPAVRLPTVTTFCVPAGVQWTEVAGTFMFPLGFGRVCTSRMLMRSGAVKSGPTPAEQAEIDRRLAEKKKEKEAKKKQKEEEEEVEQEEEQTLQRRRHVNIPESSTANRLPVEPLNWADQYYYSNEILKESEEERDLFLAKLATVNDTVERNLMMEEKKAELNNKLLATRRQEIDEKKRLQAEGEKLQKALEEQKDKPSATEEQLALLREAVLNTRQDMNLMRQTLQRVETHRVEFETIWNNFLEKSAKDMDHHVQTYIQVLDDHVTKTFTPEVVERIVKGDGGDGGDGDDDGDRDRKEKKKIGDPKEKLPQESGQVSKIKLKLPWTYNGKKEESVLHWAAAIETYVYGQRIPYWDRVLMATSCMGGDAMSFAILLQKEAGCSSMVWRIGLMGNNCHPAQVTLVLAALKDALTHVGFLKH
ncbi:hypothetical protein CBR_g51244 [Chara braunii]|uniref:Aminotransferase class V domain-containing protein n=1 Tax=Chara braunii TaxID=69332 RepID=A0A388M820_CHABU|nr:hypothetical protein CBR_g51244 [Chara braunii]|eukprot:GBG90737.1 hypothetical protein CBR_g51244 [Chara braunii]